MHKVNKFFSYKLQRLNYENTNFIDVYLSFVAVSTGMDLLTCPYESLMYKSSNISAYNSVSIVVVENDIKFEIRFCSSYNVFISAIIDTCSVLIVTKMNQ